MSFLVYFAVIVVAAASALFGLDLLTSPLPDKPSPPAASTQALNKLARREADKKEANAQQANGDDRALTPVLPTNPNSDKDVRMVYPPSNETTGATGASDKPAPAQNERPQQPEQVQPVQQQAAAPTATPLNAEHSAATTQPGAQQSENRCDVAACAAAYASFRAADCTYQPLHGPRRACVRVSDGAQRSAERAGARTPEPRFGRAAGDTRRDVQLRAIEERVREMTSSARNDVGEDDEDDAPAQGRRMIVIQRGYGWR